MAVKCTLEDTMIELQTVLYQVQALAHYVSADIEAQGPGSAERIVSTSALLETKLDEAVTIIEKAI